MKSNELPKEIKVLNDIIRNMNIRVIELINASAQAEIKQRSPQNSKKEILTIIDQIRKLINKNLNFKESNK